MRLKRKLWFCITKKLKWEFVVLLILILIINSLYRKILFTSEQLSSICEPIDVVYTWVNGSDPDFLKSINKYNPNYNPARFDDKNELKYSLRSLEKFAPWVRHIYIVTNGQIPKWLDLANERITIVPHEVLIPDTKWLPTFSSAAIETLIHRIPNLSKRFIYFNDDVFLGLDLYPEDLYTDSEGVKIYQAWLVPDCSEDCPWTYIGDGACDSHCYIEECQYDGGDCSGELKHVSNGKNLKMNIKNKIVSFDFDREVLPQKHQIPFYKYKKQNSSFKNMLLKNKNFTSIVNLRDVVYEFNKKLQTRSHVEKFADNILKTKSIESNSTAKAKDIYSQSLIYTNKILNNRYGFKVRNVIGHVGFLMETHIIEAMQVKFADEISVTLKNRFRSANDLQFAFVYYSFVMEETRRASIKEIFNEFDTDHSITWSDREIRTFLAKMFQLPLDWSIVRFFEEVIHNCSLLQKYNYMNNNNNNNNNDNNIQYTTVIYERYEDSNLPTITRDLVEKCNPLVEALEANFALRKKYKYHINPKHNLRNNFMMLTSNITEVINGLDKIRKNPRKFNCINDNLDTNSPEDNELIRHLLEDFYLSLFPQRSQFELLPQYRNRFNNWGEYLKWRRQQRAIFIAIYGISILILAYLIRTICIHKAKFVNGCIQKF